MKPEPAERAPRRALIIIPGTVNYFYNLSGRRIAEALGEHGFAVEIRTLAECPEVGEYDWCLLSNVTEILHNFGEEGPGLERIASIRRRCRAMASLSIDCVSTPWYHKIRDLSARAGVETILDLGLQDQAEALAPSDRSGYRFVFSGLTPTERSLLNELDRRDAERTVPWAFVGHVTTTRAALVDHLIQHVDPRGFVYIPAAAPYTEKGSPHLNQQQFDRVLERTRYQVWCSHHTHFYMEPERFRTSLLTGGVPIKVVLNRDEIPKSAPLSYLMLEAHEVVERMRESVFSRLRRVFWQDWGRFPTLAQELGRILNASGVPVHTAASARAA